MDKKINEKLCLFIEEGPIWEALNRLKNKYGTRYGAYANLIEAVQAMDTDTLDEACETGMAMYLAAQLVGEEAFKATMAEALHRSIKLDVADRDLTDMDGKLLHQQVRVSF